MNTNKPQLGLTSPEQGSQICNNTQIQGETDFVNYSGAGVGGFAFQNMSSTNTLTNLATMYRNGGACILNLPNPSSQFQINGANILDAVTSKAPLNSPAFTGTPTAPTATAGTSTDQLATTKFVEDAIVASGVFDSDISYTWNSAYQRFGNDQVLCIGSSTMNTTKPVQGSVSPSQGTQICNNTQTKGETDFVNYSNTGTGGFVFQQMSSTQALNTMATMYRNGGATNLNLPNASSQFQINGVNVARQTTPTTASQIVDTTSTVDVGFSVAGTITASYTFNTPTYTSTTINGVTTVNIGTSYLTQQPNFQSSYLNNINYTPSGDVPQSTTYCVLSPLYSDVPTNPQQVFINIQMTTTTGTPLQGYGAIQKSASSNTYYIVFCATENNDFQLNTTYYLQPFQFTYQ
jgi:hypothetical protein